MLPKNASRSLFITLSINFILFGTSMTIFGAAIPKIIRLYDWTYSAAGLVLAASAVGYFSSTFLSGFLIRKVGGRWLVVITLMVEGISFLFFARFPSVAINAVLNFLIGFGQGGTEVVSNVTVIQMERDGKSRLMNLLHSVFCIGAVIGPLGVAGLISSTVGWQIIYPIIGGAILVMAVIFLTRRFPEMKDVTPRVSEIPGESMSIDGGSSGGKTTTRRILLGMYSAIILLYVGIELSMSNWSSEFFVVHLGAAEGTGAFMVAVLWIGLFIGRLGLSMFYHGTRQEVVLFVLNLASTVFILLMLFSTSLAASAVLVFLVGLGLSGVYPLVMSLVGKGSRSTVAVGIVTTAGGIGSFTFPYILAFIADSAGLYRAFFLCAAVAGVTVVLNMLVISLIRKTRGVTR
jgi:fucose permease